MPQDARLQQCGGACGSDWGMPEHDTSCGAGQDVPDGINVSVTGGCSRGEPGRVHRQAGAGGMKRHKHKPYGEQGILLEAQDRSCEGCRWYHDWFGVCCNGESEQRGDVSERCPLYDGGDRDEDME